VNTRPILDAGIATLLTPTGLTLDDLDKPLGIMSRHAVDFAELYLEKTEFESWSLEESRVKNVSFSIDQGFGARAVAEAKTGFAYSDDISLESLLRAATAVSHINRYGQSAKTKLSLVTPHALYPATNPALARNNADKVALLQRLDSLTRSLDSRISEVFATLSTSFTTMLIAATDGTLAVDIRPMLRLNVTAIAKDGDRREQGSYGMGGRMSLDDLENPEQCAHEAVRQALVNLEAQAAPAGTMDVVLGSGWPGVLLHEAVGHGLEADFNRKGTSTYSNQIGKKVASPLCTIVDDGQIANRRGSLNIDDEGTPTAYNVLIENGVLKQYMQDKLNARLMGATLTGNGRRESYAHLPMPRMTNTYMLGGDSALEDMIKSVKQGIYAVNFAGGQVDITSGNFVFTTSECYLIEDGNITAPLKNVSITGNGPDVMNRVAMVGHTTTLDPGIGSCGKDGQTVPVGVGQPELLIHDMVVGGAGA
jgi:TldD protein